MITTISYAHPVFYAALNRLTDFGDAAVLLPLSLVILAWLLIMRPLKAAAAWLVTLIVCNGALVLLKINFLGCSAGSLIHSPSGHTGFSVLVYGALTAIAALEMPRGWRRYGVIAAGGCLAGTIAISRILLGDHNIEEVIFGGLVGLTGLALFCLIYRNCPRRLGGLIPLALIVSVCVVVFYGQELKFEVYLKNLTLGLRLGGLVCA